MASAIVRPYIPPQRILKALALTDTLDAAGIAATDAENMNGQEWRMLANAARTRVPSERTRELVINFLRRREVTRAAFTVHSPAANQMTQAALIERAAG
jgi:hypothetical protein